MAVRFNYFELIDLSLNLGPRIEQAFGPKGFGACLVSDIPNYVKYRQQLLPLSYKLANLPKEELKTLERPESNYTKGWSCGVEQFKGKLDVSKGSFYGNPLYDEDLPVEEVGVKYRIPNVWPQQIPELEFAFKNLGRLMMDVGALLAYHIDAYVVTQCPTYKMGTLTRFIREGDQPTGRLLHYFAQTSNDDWCGWHNDHSALTALTAPLYMTQDGALVEDFVNTSGGLMAKNRFAAITKVSIPQDHLAFQLGETAQIVTGGYVEATPHCVVGGEESRKLQLNRNTFAVFMAPKHNQILNVPEGVSVMNALNREAYNVPCLADRWSANMTYQEYSARSFEAYSK